MKNDYDFEPKKSYKTCFISCPLSTLFAIELTSIVYI